MRFDEDINARQLRADIWRSGSPDLLSADGWAELVEAGVCRVVDLRNASEIGESPDRPGSISVVHAPLEDVEDPEYASLWARNWAHPNFYAWGIGHWPELWRAAFSAIADAPSGGVLIHCAGGRDRTGVLSAILLELAGYSRKAVLEDYARGIRGTNEMLRRQGRDENEGGIPTEQLEEILPLYSLALHDLLDRLPSLLYSADLAVVARRAAARLS